MAIMFHNVKSGERRLCSTEPMISAHLNSSDLNPNAHQGQDAGWRISPATKIKLEELLQDPNALRQIATDFGIPTDEVQQTDVLMWISRQSERGVLEQKFTKRDFEREYEDDIRRLRDEQARRDKLVAAEARAKGDRVPQRILDDERSQETTSTPVEENDNVTIEPESTAPSLKSMKRDELNAYAKTTGIEKPESYSNADKLIEAISKKQEEEL